MRKHRSAPQVTHFRPRPQQLLATIRSLARTTEKINWSLHALERMDERSISTEDALRVLRIGDLCGDITAGKSVGEWKCKIVERRRGARDIGVVTLVIREQRLLVLTAEWEDL